MPNKIKSPVHNILTENQQPRGGGGGAADSADESSDYISVKTDDTTGDIVSESVRSVRNKDGSIKTFKTIHRMSKAELDAMAATSASTTHQSTNSQSARHREEQTASVGEEIVTIEELEDMNDDDDVSITENNIDSLESEILALEDDITSLGEDIEQVTEEMPSSDGSTN